MSYFYLLRSHKSIANTNQSGFVSILKSTNANIVKKNSNALLSTHIHIELSLKDKMNPKNKRVRIKSIIQLKVVI